MEEFTKSLKEFFDAVMINESRLEFMIKLIVVWNLILTGFLIRALLK